MPKVNVFDVPLIHIGGVPCESVEAGHKHLYEFAQRKDMGGYNYAFLMLEEDGSLKLVERLGMPCWGAIREYSCGTRPDDMWPGDLRDPRQIFPKTGNPIAISFQFNAIDSRQMCGTPSTDEQWNRFMTEFVFNIEVSPWAPCLKDVELIIRDGLITGALFKDTHIDPTVMSNLFKYVGRAYSSRPIKWGELVDRGYHPQTAFLSCMTQDWLRVVPERYFGQDPFDYTGGTFYDRYSYNRPDVEKIFGGKDNCGVVLSRLSIDQIEELRLSVTEKENVAV